LKMDGENMKLTEKHFFWERLKLKCTDFTLPTILEYSFVLFPGNFSFTAKSVDIYKIS